MPSLNISNAEWEAAEAWFATQPPDITKMSKKLDPTYTKGDKSKHSFIRIEGKIYAMANGQWLGEGAFGKVKVVQTRGDDQTPAQNFAVKVEGRDLRDEREAEMIAMRAIKMLKGQGVRKFDTPIHFKKRDVRSKLYTVMELIAGKELRKDLSKVTGSPKPMISALVVGLKGCIEIQNLHENGIIHADIKPENFMINHEGDQVVIRAIDYGLSRILPKGAESMRLLGWGGTLGYADPYYQKKGIVSFASDVYSLGYMFQRDLYLPYDIFRRMLAQNPKHRDPLPLVIAIIINELKKFPENELTPEAKAVLAENKKQFGKAIGALNSLSGDPGIKWEERIGKTTNFVSGLMTKEQAQALAGKFDKSMYPPGTPEGIVESKTSPGQYRVVIAGTQLLEYAKDKALDLDPKELESQYQERDEKFKQNLAFLEKITEATTVEEFLDVLENHQGDLYDEHGMDIDKEDLEWTIRQIVNSDYNIDFYGKMDAMELDDAMKQVNIPLSYGIRGKMVETIIEKYKENQLAQIEAAKAATPSPEEEKPVGQYFTPNEAPAAGSSTSDSASVEPPKDVVQYFDYKDMPSAAPSSSTTSESAKPEEPMVVQYFDYRDEESKKSESKPKSEKPKEGMVGQYFDYKSSEKSERRAQPFSPSFSHARKSTQSKLGKEEKPAAESEVKKKPSPT